MAPTYQLLIFVFVLKAVPYHYCRPLIAIWLVVLLSWSKFSLPPLPAATTTTCISPPHHPSLNLFLSHFSSSHRKGFHDADCDLKKVSLSVDSKIQDNSGSRRGRGSLLLLMCRVVAVDVVGKIVDISAARYRCHTATPCPVGCWKHQTLSRSVVEIAPWETWIIAPYCL